jgi:hypothetical protein
VTARLIPCFSYSFLTSRIAGPEYYVNILSFVDRDLLEPGSSVLTHNKVLSIVGILADDTDPLVSVMKVRLLAFCIRSCFRYENVNVFHRSIKHLLKVTQILVGLKLKFKKSRRQVRSLMPVLSLSHVFIAIISLEELAYFFSAFLTC